MLLSVLTAGSQSAEERAVTDVLVSYQEKAEQRLKPRFSFAGIDWPPKELTLLAVKHDRRLELWARSGDRWGHIRDYRIKGISGGPGPKLREGDDQVPEGHYRIAGLNANSAFHLSLKIDYPNRFDRRQALRDGRTNLGDDIYIHGKSVSRGCLAIGDNAVEELFVLAALTGEEKINVLISPRDFRRRPPDNENGVQAGWVRELYHRIAEDMARYPRP